MSKDVRIELTESQKAKIKAATGKTIGELHVSKVGDNVAVTPAIDLRAQDTRIQAEDLRAQDTRIQAEEMMSIQAHDMSIKALDLKAEDLKAEDLKAEDLSGGPLKQ
jgi:lipopolysaccharide export system protein LptC